ncbi:MAG: DUF3127 domain-containing protein [Bacteroidetes bacterium]|nr:DUF3127 domain-containing protein [Bacteroidota bacterium]
MEITGKIIQILPEEKGEGRNGPWKKQSFIIETQEQFPKKVCIINWGDKVDLKSNGVNDTVTVSINIESREFNGKWITNVKAWRMIKADAPSQANAPPQENIPPYRQEVSELEGGSVNDLPF